MQDSLSNLLLFNKLDKFVQQKIVADTYEKAVPAGEILIQQGDTGLAAAQLYVVKSGKFEVRAMRRMRGRGLGSGVEPRRRTTHAHAYSLDSDGSQTAQLACILRKLFDTALLPCLLLCAGSGAAARRHVQGGCDTSCRAVQGSLQRTRPEGTAGCKFNYMRRQQQQLEGMEGARVGWRASCWVAERLESAGGLLRCAKTSYEGGGENQAQERT